jgi:hypothetical protein
VLGRGGGDRHELVALPTSWPNRGDARGGLAGRGLDVVVGNWWPARPPTAARRRRAGGTPAVVVGRLCRHRRPPSRRGALHRRPVVLVQLLSFLGARDAGVVRRHLEAHSVLESVWLADDRLFGAAVDVCAAHAADPPRIRWRHLRAGAGAQGRDRGGMRWPVTGWPVPGARRRRAGGVRGRFPVRRSSDRAQATAGSRRVLRPRPVRIDRRCGPHRCNRARPT